MRDITCHLAFVYFTPFLGGMIADRFIGYRKAVLIGGILMAAGLFLLGVRSLTTFYGGLTLLCLGNGFFNRRRRRSTRRTANSTANPWKCASPLMTDHTNLAIRDTPQGSRSASFSV